MRKTLTIIAMLFIIIGALSATETRYISDNWLTRYTLTISDTTRFSLITETYRQQTMYDWMRLRTDLTAEYGNWMKGETGITLVFDDGHVDEIIPEIQEDTTLVFQINEKKSIKITDIEYL